MKRRKSWVPRNISFSSGGQSTSTAKQVSSYTASGHVITNLSNASDIVTSSILTLPNITP